MMITAELEVVFFARSREQNLRFANNLKKSYKALFFDLFRYQELPLDLGYIKKFDNIILTSSKSAEIVKNLQLAKNFFVVGKSSYEILKNLGTVKVFNNIEELENNGIPQSSLYLSGNIITKEINTERIVIYKTAYENKLPGDIKQYLPFIDHLLLFSTVNTIKILNLIEHYIPQNCKITAISEKVAKICLEKNFPNIYIDASFSQFIIKD